MARNRKTPTAQAVDQSIPEAPTVESVWSIFKATLASAFCPEGVSWQRNLLGWVLGLASSFVVGAGIGIVCNILMLAALSSGLAFVAYIIFALSLLASMYFGSKVSTAVYTTVVFGPSLFNFGSTS